MFFLEMSGKGRICRHLSEQRTRMVPVGEWALKAEGARKFRHQLRAWFPGALVLCALLWRCDPDSRLVAVARVSLSRAGIEEFLLKLPHSFIVQIESTFPEGDEPEKGIDSFQLLGTEKEVFETALAVARDKHQDWRVCRITLWTEKTGRGAVNPIGAAITAVM